MNDKYIEISINQNESLVELVERMLKIKSENNKDVICNIGSGSLITDNCNAVDDMYVKNSNIIFRQYNEAKKEFVASNEFNEMVEEFNNFEALTANLSEEELKQINLKENKLNELLEKIDQINDEDVDQVCEWLDDVKPYVNDPIFNNYTKENEKLSTIISRKLKEKGFQLSMPMVSNIKDFKSEFIINDIKDLEKYGFFPLYRGEIKINEDELTEDFVEENQEEVNLSNIEVLNNYEPNSLFELLNKLISEKKEQGKDIQFITDEKTYDTVGCTTREEIRTKYAAEFFEEYENTRKKYPRMTAVVNLVKDFRDKNKPVNQDVVDQLLNDYNGLYNFQISVNFKNPKQVNDWVKEVGKKFINNYDFNTGLLENKNIDISKNTVSILEQHGYTENVEEVNTVDDYYRKLIGYKIEELKKYKFIVSDYANNTIKETEMKIAEIDKQIEKTDKKVMILQQVYEGRRDLKTKQFTTPYDKRKEEITKRISEIETQPVESISMKEIYENADKELEKLNVSESMMKIYTDAKTFPYGDKFNKTLEEAFKISKDDENRTKIIETVEKLQFRYEEEKYNNIHLDEIKNKVEQYQGNELEQTVISLCTGLNKESSKNDILIALESAINLPKNSEIRDDLIMISQIHHKEQIELEEVNRPQHEIENLKEEYRKIELEQEKYKKVLEKEQQKLEQLQNEKQQLKQNIEEKELDMTFVNMVQENYENKLGTTGSTKDDNDKYKNGKDKKPKDNENSTTNNVKTEDLSTEDFIKKLEGMDQIFTDTERDTVEEEIDEKPHKITEIKKAGLKLLEKIKESQFAEKIKQALNFCKEHKKAVATAIILAGGVLLGSQLGKNNEEAIIINGPSIETSQEVNEDNQTMDNNDASMNDSEIDQEDLVEVNVSDVDQAFLESINQAKDNILDGGSVYVSAFDAQNDTNKLYPTDKQLEERWQNSEVGAYYQLDENGNPQMLNQEEAQNAWQNGEPVVVRMDDDDTKLGFKSL